MAGAAAWLQADGDDLKASRSRRARRRRLGSQWPEGGVARSPRRAAERGGAGFDREDFSKPSREDGVGISTPAAWLASIAKSEREGKMKTRQRPNVFEPRIFTLVPYQIIKLG